MPAKTCIAMSFDAKFFYQAKACIQTIKAYCKQESDICVLGIHLEEHQRTWLLEQQVVLVQDYTLLPRYQGDFPAHAYSQICRPFLGDLFPGYEVYLWVDADIRFVQSDAFDFYLDNAREKTESITICQEVDPAYGIVNDPRLALGYHKMINERIKSIFGSEVLQTIQYYYNLNTGIWAMHRASRVWDWFRQALAFSFSHGYNHMREQDALNIAILKSGIKPVLLSPTMNWLCAMALPKRDAANGLFLRPDHPHVPLSVLHLIASESLLKIGAETIRWYDLYRRLGLTD